MLFNREIFERLAGPFNDWPIVLCPECAAIALEPDIKEFESYASISARGMLDSDLKEGYFYGELKCPRLSCGNRYVVTGSWSIEWGPASIQGTEDDPYLRGYLVTHILPPLPLMKLPEAVPPQLRAIIESASATLFSDTSATANRIRSAIDCMLTHKKIARFSRNSRRPLTTHRRIEIFEEKNASAAKQLMAMKWIGNVGSHEVEQLPFSWLLDGIEHFSRAIELIYDPHEKMLAARAEKINKRGRRLRPTEKNLLR
ncbi:DUF4145 domain-containing protein [Streptosporangium sandarakinum]|uniref:DUF4145 domain-containing protein n=1 Tax=Streptosporangium sandarakinum TaxID=1260955 RepID=A0A852V903_9ACTN|nr:DUF4145 domain-containing protein [Streptosporangium sandarakinum]NYF42921.1 hypothetical protein [Streptosporangium sandarakinum]